MSPRSPALQAAYEAAVYTVSVRSQTHRIRIGCRHPLLDRRLRGLGCQQWWHLITACNPRSEPLTATENAVRLRRLGDDLAALGVRHLPARNSDCDGGWPEPAYCLLDTAPATARMLAQRHAQHALVTAHLDASARLLWMPDAAGSGA